MIVFLKSTSLSFAVLENALVEDLIEQLHDVRMRLFDLVEQDDAVGRAPHRFGQHPALPIPDIAGRRALEARDRMRL